MGHIVHIQSQDQLMAAYRVLDTMPGTWHSRGAAEFPTLLVLESHFKALVKAGVISANGKQEKIRGKKTPAKKGNS